MSLTTRLLGLAFASADALVELNAKGDVVFAMGAAAVLGQDAGATWKNRPFIDVLHDGSSAMAAIRHTRPGARSAQMDILISAEPGQVRRAFLRAFVLPELAPAISCAITYDGPAFPIADLQPPALLDVQAFLADAGRIVAETPGLSLAFLDIQGVEGLSGDAAERVHHRIQATLQSAAAQGSSAAKITAERFALLRPADDQRDLAAEIIEAGRTEGVALNAEAYASPVPEQSDNLCVLRAMRFAIEGCLKDGGLANPQVAFSESLKRTLRDAELFRNLVKARAFQLHYQPIVDLSTRAVHHFEALARFSPNNSPADAIRMAEELDLIESFDLAVAEKVLKRMRRPGAGLLKMAINVSGASLGSDAYVEQLLHMTSGAPEERSRLIVEVTETAALADIEAANRRIAALRAANIKVCIDDFGAGSAVFDYLRNLSVDAVKIDGSLVRDIDTDNRARTMLRSVTELCQSLNLETIAEMIETEAVATQLKALGVTYGQGWLFGRAEAEPRTNLSGVTAVRRRGAVEAWG